VPLARAVLLRVLKGLLLLAGVSKSSAGTAAVPCLIKGIIRFVGRP
jgi:hypothetical protein